MFSLSEISISYTFTNKLKLFILDEYNSGKFYVNKT